MLRSLKERLEALFNIFGMCESPHLAIFHGPFARWQYRRWWKEHQYCVPQEEEPDYANLF